MLLTGILFVLLLIAGAIFYIMNKKVAQKDSGGGKRDLFELVCPVAGVEEMPVVRGSGEVERWGLLVLPDGAYRVILALRGINFNLLTDEEKASIAASLRGTAFALGYPVQFFTTTQMLDLTRAAQEIAELGRDLTGPLAEYAFMQIQYFEALSRTRQVTTRRAYAVLGVSGHTREQAERELYSLVSRFASAVEPVGAKVRVLTPEAVYDLLFSLLNRDRIFRPSLSLEKGGLSLYKKGVTPVAEVAEEVTAF
ncbi:hypothetical protein SAMN00808754_1473 [Thermanaeromonas toyohensis ToBE]|uniref:Uncharacterized protein n=1 Tax=Thermanaeromonas toyohensis ToBE TaxID=698762 RepID=A0A1W1VSL8_9FIRM|nr:hypothetical protein SAMN00808754_1473 [Thermanaeromonas toyohensis ToBE]